MEYQVIDNFLEKEQFQVIRDQIVFNDKFPFYLSEYVTYKEEMKNVSHTAPWYATHMVYNENSPQSSLYDPFSQIFLPRFKELNIFKSLLRIKVNFYPPTNKLREHSPHSDYQFKCYGAVFSLNTCNGFTRINENVTIPSVENRIVFFDASQLHNSTSTSDSKGRFNINFNFL